MAQGKILKLINSRDGVVQGVGLVINKEMWNKTITIGRPIQHLIPLEMSKEMK